VDLKQYSQEMPGILDSSGKDGTVTKLKHYLIYPQHFKLECTNTRFF